MKEDTYIKTLRLYKPDGIMLEFTIFEEHEEVGEVKGITQDGSSFTVKYEHGATAEFGGFPYSTLRYNRS